MDSREGCEHVMETTGGSVLAILSFVGAFFTGACYGAYSLGEAHGKKDKNLGTVAENPYDPWGLDFLGLFS